MEVYSENDRHVGATRRVAQGEAAPRPYEGIFVLGEERGDHVT